MAFQNPSGWFHDLTTEEIGRMHQAALRVLSEVGMQVYNQAALQSLARVGVRLVGDRAFFPPELVEERLSEMLSNGPVSPRPPARERLTISVSDMCQYYHNPTTDQIGLMFTEDLIEATRCVEVLRDTGLAGGVPGVPRDVPQQLQAIMEYRVGCEYSSAGGNVDTMYPPEAVPFLLEMAAAMGRPIRGIGMFTVSPLRMAGFEFDAAVERAEYWQSFHVHSLPAVGATAPIHPRAAWVLSIAEAVGGAVILYIVGGGKPVSFVAGMYPFDLRTLAIVGGAPEFAWMCWAGAQVNRYYHPGASYSMMLGTQAKRPGMQAGLEKGLAGAFGVATGCDDVHYAGVLSYDDILSPVQMVADVELRDALQHLARGIPCDDPESWIEEIRAGIGEGYVRTDATLDHYGEIYWFPRILDRTTWHTYEGGSGRDAEERARQEILKRLAGYSYRPPAESIERVRGIFREAWRQLGGDPVAPFLSALENG
ncbi:MAG: trimethylamine methyltransferase family protein [Anaerolineae bacterium]